VAMNARWIRGSVGRRDRGSQARRVGAARTLRSVALGAGDVCEGGLRATPPSRSGSA